MCLRWHFDSITKIVLCACDDGIWRALCPHRNDVIWLGVGNNLDLWRNTGHLGISHSMSSPKSSSSLCSVTSSSTLICDLKVGSCYDTRWWRLWWWCRYWCRRWYYDIDNWITLGASWQIFIIKLLTSSPWSSSSSSSWPSSPSLTSSWSPTLVRALTSWHLTPTNRFLADALLDDKPIYGLIGQ